MGLIPENILEDILNRVDIVEVISAYIPLKRSGRNFKALCPFHHEKTGSFMVSPDRQIYHCFGCGESGNVYKFLMRYERMEFPEAVELLAKKAGVILPQKINQDPKTAGLVSEIYKINESAAIFYQANLRSAHGEGARAYLLKRGISDEAIAVFGIGLALEKWDALIAHLRAKNVPIRSIEAAGLALPKDSGGYYDRFRNRIIFPIRDIKSRVLGFGARVQDETLPKYINSPETPVYIKGRNLYGLDLSKDSIRDCDSVAIVEGYMDFIMPYQAGFKNIVAGCGTAFTPEQARLIKRYTHNVVIVYDPDKAGEVAALRSLDIFVEEGMSVKVATLTAGLDPDTFVRKHGLDAFKDKIEHAQTLFDYKMQVLKSRFNARDIEDKAKIARQMLETVAKIDNSVIKSEYIKKLAQSLDVREEALLQELKKVSKPGVSSNPEVSKPVAVNVSAAEKLLLKLILEEEGIIHRLKKILEPEDFSDSRLAEVIKAVFKFAEQGKGIGPNILMESFGREDISQLIGESVFLPEEIAGQDLEKLADDCVLRIKQDRLKLRRARLHEEIKVAQVSGDQDKLNRLLEEFHILIKSK